MISTNRTVFQTRYPHSTSLTIDKPQTDITVLLTEVTMLVVTKEHLLYFWTSKLRFLDQADVIFTQLHNSSSAIFVSLLLFAFCFFSEK